MRNVACYVYDVIWLRRIMKARLGMNGMGIRFKISEQKRWLY